jgi:hypothetical protein
MAAGCQIPAKCIVVVGQIGVENIQADSNLEYEPDMQIITDKKGDF